jgi:glycosyltransferase involved in cell wall biosynthesis
MLLEGGQAKINKHNLPVVSIIIVTYNAASTLQNCLDSIYSQSYSPIEIIVIDGRSTDDTTAILQANNQRIHYWRSEPDAGIYDAMNKALTYITGDWVYFLGADDELLPEFSTMAGALTHSDTIYYANVLSNGKIFWGEVSHYHIAKYGIYHQAVMYPKAVFNKYHYNTKYIIRADHVLNMQCANDDDFKLAYRNEVIAKYNHLGFSNATIDKNFEADQVALVFKYFSLKISLRIAYWKFKEKYIRKKSQL